MWRARCVERRTAGSASGLRKRAHGQPENRASGRLSEIPGGCVEADESPYQAAIRECREELGLDLAPGRLLVVDWVPARAGRTEGLMVVFDGGTLEPRAHERIVVPPGELKGWAFSDPPEAAQRLPPLLTRRITEALNARADGCSYYLEDGVRVT
ncbi:NUDIX domain-containing protein [Micromonospora sp. LOL_024]|uniref:NUDIX domain-containing protein n=1 Tax=Micromonospora sp. LOL_024 TaxID=3345412 RepID=UPI003A89363D